MKTEKRYCYQCSEEKDFQILSGTETAVLRESSHAELWESSHAVLRESSHAVLWESSHAVLWESSHAELWGSSHAVLRESSSATGHKYNSITLHGQKVHCKGGVQIHISDNFTAREWCDFYGVEIEKGVAILYKGLDDDYSTANARTRGLIYTPRTIPVAADWDGGKKECGGGIHLSPTPHHTLDFNSDAKIFMAFPVKLSQIKPYKDAQYPAKVKVKTVCAPIYEVDIDGKRKEPKP